MQASPTTTSATFVANALPARVKKEFLVMMFFPLVCESFVRDHPVPVTGNSRGFPWRAA
jgi:hypothetical protein